MFIAHVLRKRGIIFFLLSKNDCVFRSIKDMIVCLYQRKLQAQRNHNDCILIALFSQ